MILKVENISFGYTSKEVINNISFSAKKGDYIAIIGESGCGKSTILEIIYGLLHIEKGAVYWDSTKLRGPNYKLIPGEEFMKYLPQDFDLMPYSTVEDNVGKHISYLDPNRLNRINELLEVVDMSDFLKTKVVNLSGGQKQRVALAKVIAKEPEILLLDEPFSHIDNFRKNKLRRDLFRYLKSKNILCIVATHDTTDALSFADEIVVIKNGALVAKNNPEGLYNNLNNSYVGSFFNEVNELTSVDMDPNSTSNEVVLLYPNQLKVVKNSTIKVVVIQSYFKGNFYLIEAFLNNKVIYFEHSKKIESNKQLFLKITK